MADSVWDYGVLSVQLVVSVFLLALTTYAIMVVDHLRSVMNRDTLTTSCITVGFLLWSWSALVSNRHFSLLFPLGNWSCALWDFWLQYAFGLNLVFTLINIRLNWHRLIQEHKSAIQMRRQTLLMACVCGLPTLLVCAGVEYNGGTHLVSGSCRAQDGWKYALMGTLLLNYMGMIRLLAVGLRYQYTTRDHKELLYGTVAASATLLLILVLNMSRQTGHTYGRVLTGLAINATSVSLFYGLIGSPLFHSLRRVNEYELALQLSQQQQQQQEQDEDRMNSVGVVQVMANNVAYGHYLGWLLQRYDYNNKELLKCNKTELPLIIVPSGLNADSDIMREFCDYVRPVYEDPEEFLFRPYFMVKLLQKLEVTLDSKRSPDCAWKCSLDNAYIKQGGKYYVMLPYRLQQELLFTFIDNQLNYSNLLFCTKLWLLAQLEHLTWNSYKQDTSSGLQACIKTINSPYVQRFVSESHALQSV